MRVAHWDCGDAEGSRETGVRSPSQPSHVVDRPALRRKLDAVVDHSIALIVALVLIAAYVLFMAIRKR